MEIFLGIGSNIGDRLTNLQYAYDAFTVVQSSSVYETEPVGFQQQPWFLNSVLQIKSALLPSDLLKYCLSIESNLGRKREILKGPRTIDIDILFYGSRILEESDLTVPHPEISNRRFVLEPMNEIASDFVHPVSRKTISELLDLCPDRSVVRKFASG